MTRPRPDLDTSPYTLEFPSQRIATWREVFGNDRPVELEVGPGKGLFLANAGRAHPERNFVGVEAAPKYARLAAERVTKQAIGNVRVVTGDAIRFLAEFVPDRSLRAVHIYFPDPWWKKRHHKRRVFREEFVRDVARSLERNGDFHVATDVEDYFTLIQSLMNSHAEFALRPPPEPNAPQHELDYLTNFERKYRMEGRPIYRAHYGLCVGNEPAQPAPPLEHDLR